MLFCFDGIYSKIHEKITFFGLYFLIKSQKNYQRVPNGGGVRLYGTPVAQGMSPAEKNEVSCGEEPKFCPMAARLKVIAHGFEHFSWAPPG